MDTIIYYSEMDGISLEHLKRSRVMICVLIIFTMNTRFIFTEARTASFLQQPGAYQVKKGSLILVDKLDPYDPCHGR